MKIVLRLLTALLALLTVVSVMAGLAVAHADPERAGVVADADLARAQEVVDALPGVDGVTVVGCASITRTAGHIVAAYVMPTSTDTICLTAEGAAWAVTADDMRYIMAHEAGHIVEHRARALDLTVPTITGPVDSPHPDIADPSEQLAETYRMAVTGAAGAAETDLTAVRTLAQEVDGLWL